MEFTREDLLGPRADKARLEASPAWQELRAMEGLEEVKQAVSELVELVLQNADREELEKSMLSVALNRIFLG